MRRAGLALIAALFMCATATLAAGCGGSASTPHPVGASGQALALANAINLRPADVPGLVARFPRDRETRSGPLGNCDPRSIEGLTGFSSQRFTRGGTRVLPTAGVSSVVYLMASETQAAREWAALGSSRARVCLQHDVESAIKGERGTAEPFLATPVDVLSLARLLRPLPVAGIRRIEGVAIASPFGHGRSKLYLDQSGFVVGRVLVGLLAMGSPHPFPLASEHRLLSLLYSRAEAHKIS
jgi:hypothetical protein